MDLIAPWLIFPAVFAALCVGCGLLVERISGRPLPGALLAPLGFAALVVVTQLAVVTGATAELALPAVAVLAVAGFVLGFKRLGGRRPDLWAIAVAAVTFVVFAAPAVLTGERTFLGYTSLGDASIHFALIDRLMEHGRDLAGVPESSYRLAVDGYFVTAYPTGGHTVLGALQDAIGIDVAWLFQPYLSMLAAMLALALLPLARTLTSRPWLAAGGAALAAQPGLVYAYAVQQEALKELATVVLLVLLVALVRPLLAAPPTARSVAPLAVATGAALGVLNLAVVPWLGPLLLVTLVALARRHGRPGRTRVAIQAAVFSVTATVLALPQLVQLAEFTETNRQVLTAGKEYGNLVRDLDFVQVFGIWPRGDFRLELNGNFEYALIGFAVVAALFGVVWAVRRRSWDVLMLAAVSTLGFLVVLRAASPWAYGKSLMILSPAVALLAFAGIAAAWEQRRRAEGAILAIGVAAGFLWTNALAYHAIDSAPYDRLHEMETIADRIGDRGPTLVTEFEEYAKHFLRDAAPVGMGDAWRPQWAAARPGTSGGRFGFSTDVDEMYPESVARFRHAVLRRMPTASRPPSDWTRTFRGRYYDVWERAAGGARIVEHLALGGDATAAAQPPCSEVERLAGVARDNGGDLVAAERPAATRFPTAQMGVPTNWARDRSDRDVLRAVGAGRVEGPVTLPVAGRWHVWIEGSFGRPVTVKVDGRAVGVAENHLNPRGLSLPVAELDLPAGEHVVTLERGGPGPDPRDGSLNRLVGPVTFTLEADPGGGELLTVAPDDWRTLCGRTLDWVEAVA